MTYIAPTTKGWTSQVFGTRPGGFNPAGGHTGEDIAIPVGTPLVAMAEGVIVHVGYFKGAYSDNPWWISPSFAGYVVTVDYGKYISHYAHCSGSPVLSGKRVQQGDVVAYSGNTGTATTGPHLHWEVMPDGWNFNNGTYGRIDPRSVLGGLAAMGDTTTVQEDEDDMPYTPEQLKQFSHEGTLRALNEAVDNSVGGKSSVLGVVGSFDKSREDTIARTAALLLDTEIPRAGEFGGNTSLRGVLAYADQKHIEALRATVTAAHGDGISADQIIQAVRDALAAGVKVEASVTVGP